MESNAPGATVSATPRAARASREELPCRQHRAAATLGSMGSWLGIRSGLILCVVLGTSCIFGPSRQRVDCLQSCARYKDGCILESRTAADIQHCDEKAALCSEQCPQ